MPAKLKRALKLETEWLRAYARTYLPCETPFSFSADLLRRVGVSLVDIRNALRSCQVVFADKLEERGAIWVAEGKDADERTLLMTVKVVSDEISVELRNVERVELEGDGNDAA